MQCRPLRERVFRGTIGTNTGSVVTATEERGAYKNWSGDQMDKAVKAIVGDGKASGVLSCSIMYPDRHFLTG